MARRSVCQSGITLIEMLVVMSLMVMFVGISFSSISAGLGSLQLKSSASETAAFINTAANQVERKQEPVDVHISADGRTIVARAMQTGSVRTFHLSDGIHVADPPKEHVVFYPGGGRPRFILHLVSGRGGHRTVSLDPVTGVAYAD